MSIFTDRVYAAWRLQNGYSGPRHRPHGGMGAVAPMVTLQAPFQLTDFAANAVMRRRTFSRLDQQKKTPASATNTPEVMTNIHARNDDGTNCRP